ncbi:MAG: hypothetical protein ACRCTZ_07765, partial [Sarcina sp.]
FEENKSIEEIQYDCKKEARFSGSLRKNMINMLDSIGLNNAFNISSCLELFGDKDYLLHTVSLIPYPVFVKKKNYTGHTPKLLKNEFLMKYVYGNFIDELNSLEGSESILLIPLGKAVEEVLELLAKEGLICESQILKGFPHPSGANVNRLKDLEKNRERLELKVKKFSLTLE